MPTRELTLQVPLRGRLPRGAVFLHSLSAILLHLPPCTGLIRPALIPSVALGKFLAVGAGQVLFHVDNAETMLLDAILSALNDPSNEARSMGAAPTHPLAHYVPGYEQPGRDKDPFQDPPRAVAAAPSPRCPPLPLAGLQAWPPPPAT